MHKPKPTALHRLHGTYRATRHRERKFEPIADGPLVEPPGDLTAAQRKIWHYAIRHAPKGVLMMIDAEMLRSWVITIERRDRLQDTLEILWGDPDWERNAAHRHLDAAISQLRALAGELGFSPAARPRLRVQPTAQSAPNPNDPWALLKLVSNND